MKTFKQFREENLIPVNTAASGNIAGFDPLIKPKKIMRRKNVANKLPS